MKPKPKKLLSVIIPSYRQALTIKQDLETVNKVLAEGLVDMDYEIICVIDGYVDDTFKRTQMIASSTIKIVGYEKNKGKGYAVRYGIARAKGDLISFLDAGMDISPKGIMMLIAHMDWYNADIIVGSKRHPVSKVNYPFFRRILSAGYHLGIKILFDLPLTDTQSGIKIFKRKVLEKVLPRLLVKKYAMDIEILAVAKRLGFDRIYEAPIEVTFNRDTRIIYWPTIFRMAWDTMAVFYRLKIQGYYDEKNKKNWAVDPELSFQA